MIYCKHLMLIGLTLCMGQVLAIEAPKTQAPEQQAPSEAPRPSITPTDETAFFSQLQRSTHWRNLRGLSVPADAIQNLAEGRADLAVAALNGAAAQGSEDANIALVRIQHWCGRVGSARPSNTQEQIAKLSPELSEARAARAAGVLVAEAAFLPRAAEGCRAAKFDYGAIEDRLRDAADAGKPASATELAQFTRDPKKRNALLEQATKQQYAPALYAVATRRVVDVQRAERTEDVASIRLFLKQAGRTLPKAKVDLANCVALGCDGHPANAATALAFGIDAARDGEPSAFLSMMRMPWGRRLPRNQLLAWQYFGDRLNEAGCMGDTYIVQAVTFAQSIALLTKGAQETLISQAKEEAEQLWRDNSGRARKEQGCASG
jgi:hypothetical protein